MTRDNVQPWEVRFWARLEHLENAFSNASRIPEHIEKYACKFDRTDPVYARFCRDRFNPERVRQHLKRIRFKAQNLSMDKAVEELSGLQVDVQHIEMQALRRDLITGRKQNEVLDGHRAKAIENSALAKDQRQRLISEIVANSTRLKGSNLKNWVRERLKEDHGIHVVPRTISRDFKEMKIDGQTG